MRLGDKEAETLHLVVEKFHADGIHVRGAEDIYDAAADGELPGGPDKVAPLVALLREPVYKTAATGLPAALQPHIVPAGRKRRHQGGGGGGENAALVSEIFQDVAAHDPLSLALQIILGEYHLRQYLHIFKNSELLGVRREVARLARVRQQY